MMKLFKLVIYHKYIFDVILNMLLDFFNMKKKSQNDTEGYLEEYSKKAKMKSYSLILFLFGMFYLQ